MTDTGQVPGEGLPENAGMVEQPGAPAHGAYTYLSETTAEDEDLLLLPGAQSAWGNEVAPPAPEPVVEAVHEPGPHETGGRDSGSVDLSGVRLPGPSAPQSAPRRPLHLGPPIPDTSASPVRSLADRGPAGAPVRQAGPTASGPEYLDAPHLREMPPQGAAPWGAAQATAQVTAQAPVAHGVTAAETVVPAPAAAPQPPEPAGVAQAVVARVATEAIAATAPQEAQAAQEAPETEGAPDAPETGAAGHATGPDGGAPARQQAASAYGVVDPGELLGAAMMAEAEQASAAEGAEPAQDAAGVAFSGGDESHGERAEESVEESAEAGAAPVVEPPVEAPQTPEPAQDAGPAFAEQHDGAAEDTLPSEPVAAEVAEPAGAADTAEAAEPSQVPRTYFVDAAVAQAAEAAQASPAEEPQQPEPQHAELQQSELQGFQQPHGDTPAQGPEAPAAETVPAAEPTSASHPAEVPGLAPDPTPAPGAAQAHEPAVTATPGVSEPAAPVREPAASAPEAGAPGTPFVPESAEVSAPTPGSDADADAEAVQVVGASVAPVEAAPVELTAQPADPESVRSVESGPEQLGQPTSDVESATRSEQPAESEPQAESVSGPPSEAQPASAAEDSDELAAPVSHIADSASRIADAPAPSETAPHPEPEPEPQPDPEAQTAAPEAADLTEVPQPAPAVSPADPYPDPESGPEPTPQPEPPTAQSPASESPAEALAPAAPAPAAPTAVPVDASAVPQQVPAHPQPVEAPVAVPAPLAEAPGVELLSTAIPSARADHGLEPGRAGHADRTDLPEPAHRAEQQPGADHASSRSLGRFVQVEGTVPSTPHLAPTPPHPLVIPADEQVPGTAAEQPQAVEGDAAPSAVTVPAPRGADPAPAPAIPDTEHETDIDPDVAQSPEDLETRAADQEESPAAVEEVQESTGPAAPAYDDAEREAVLKVMRERRDIRNGFRADPIPHEVLLRVLEAAHTAPSVGHSQPWDFVVIRSADTRRAMHELATRQRDAYAKSLPKGRAKQFKELKIEAILDTPVNIVVTADPTRGGRHTLGRHTQPQMAPYSSALAVENLWLAARAEGLGVGWVSFFDEREMVRALGLPEHLEVVAYLCVGYVDEFPDEPELMQAGWAKRRPLSWVVHEETYGRRALPGEDPHDLLAETVASVRPLDAKALGEAWERQKRMTKPAGALGMLEIISAQLSGLSRQCPPPIPEPAAVAIFAGDHGVHAQGVTPWPQEVTAQMVANFLGGGAVCNAFATQVGAEVCVVDVGVAADLPSTPGLLPRKIRAGTSDMTTGPAMTREEAKQAIEVGIETARDLVAAGNKALLTGEMGIANTTASAALISVFTGADPAEVTGRGTGINDETLARKTEVVRRALEVHQPDPADPIGVLAAIGGFEHAAMVGLLLGGASLRTPVILDGVSAGAAALVARAIAPEVLAACIAGHRSAEPGHVAALNKLGLRPLVDLDLRLGEGTGALLALPLVQSTARAMHEVATFDSAGVTEK
ncbi:nicotinate-nucleotide--dimethylbenzimidazole phosphoribosyltransferase [Streptomyces sp. NPDC051445]|uniref:nicotinate-nucleotide--dimethylbenzimidazole phosphoribosyltransferase n=1 Tax=Streptomyces sp. NPDC051445 TaxID=3365653 RepID=UPI0037934B54